MQEAVQDHGPADGRPQLRPAAGVWKAARVCPLPGRSSFMIIINMSEPILINYIHPPCQQGIVQLAAHVDCA
jgi:hypothetical protein